MVDIPLTRRGVLRRSALALPMEQILVDGIVVIHGRGRIILIRLIERDEEHVKLLFRQPLHTLADGGGLHKVQCHQ